MVRHYEPADDIEARWGLPPGALASTAFEPDLLRQLTTGRLSRQAWVREVGERLGHPRAAHEWGSRPGRIDHAVVEVIDDLRDSGRKVALFSNGSDELTAELDALGVLAHVDGLVNSAEIGVAKPDLAAFATACELVGVDPRHAAFVDDSPANVDAAAELGMTAHRYTELAALRAFLSDLLSDLTAQHLRRSTS